MRPVKSLSKSSKATAPLSNDSDGQAVVKSSRTAAATAAVELTWTEFATSKSLRRRSYIAGSLGFWAGRRHVLALLVDVAHSIKSNVPRRAAKFAFSKL